MAAAINKAETFRTMHLSRPGFVMPNAWDAGSAVILAEEGFKAIATTSGGIAFSLAKPDYYVGDGSMAVTRAEMFDRIRAIVDAVDVPVNGDLEAGYGDSPESIAETIRLAIQAGLAGGNLEDKDPCRNGLYDETLAVERIKAARETIDALGSAFVLTARTDAFQGSPASALSVSIRRCNLFREAGADCLFAPGISDPETVRLMVREVQGPLNVVMGLGNSQGNAHQLLEAGVQRISLGASIARAALAFVRNAAREVMGRGSIGYAANQIPQATLCDLFVRSRKARAIA